MAVVGCSDSALRDSPLGVNVARDDVIHESLPSKYLELASELSDRPEGGFARSDGIRESKYYWWEHENLPGDSQRRSAQGLAIETSAVGLGSRKRFNDWSGH